MLPKNYRIKIEKNLKKLWDVWRTLGLYSEGSNIAISPEEAIIGLCIFGRYDQRLFDEALSIIILHSRFISKNRLQFILKKIDKDSKRVFHVIASILQKFGDDSRFVSIIEDKTHGNNQEFFINLNNRILFTGKKEDNLFLQFSFKRNIFAVSEKIRNLQFISQINPWIKAKLIYGNTVRADIVIELINRENCTAPDIAYKTGYTQKSVWNVLKDFELAGFVNGKKSFNRIVYSLSDSGKKQFSQFRLKKTPPNISGWLKMGHYISAIKNYLKMHQNYLYNQRKNRLKGCLKVLKFKHPEANILIYKYRNITEGIAFENFKFIKPRLLPFLPFFLKLLN